MPPIDKRQSALLLWLSLLSVFGAPLVACGAGADVRTSTLTSPWPTMTASHQNELPTTGAHPVAVQRQGASLRKIDGFLAKVRIVDYPAARFVRVGAVVQAYTPDGRSLQAVVGRMEPTGDGRVQDVFVWYDGRLAGVTSHVPVLGVHDVRWNGSVVSVQYLQYSESDPLCCPSLPLLTVPYRVSSGGIGRHRLPSTVTAGSTAPLVIPVS